MCTANDQGVPEYEWIRRAKRATRLGLIVVLPLMCLYVLGIAILLSWVPESLWYIAAVVPFAVTGWIGAMKVAGAIYGACGLRCPHCEVVMTPNGSALWGHWYRRLGANDINCPRCRKPVIEVDYRPTNVVTRTITQEEMIDLAEWSRNRRRAAFAGGIGWLLYLVLLVITALMVAVWGEGGVYGLLLVPALLGWGLLILFWVRWAGQANSVVCPACGIEIGPNGYGLGQKDKGYVRLSRSSRRCPRCRTVILPTEEEGEQ